MSDEAAEQARDESYDKLMRVAEHLAAVLLGVRGEYMNAMDQQQDAMRSGLYKETMQARVHMTRIHMEIERIDLAIQKLKDIDKEPEPMMRPE